VARFETPDEGNVNVRPYRPEDEPILREIYERAGYGQAFPENLAEYFIVTDDAGCPIMAAGYTLVPEITLICAPGGSTHPLVKLKGITLLHESVRDTLAAKGFKEAFASIPPQLERSYGRHLQRHFKWLESWKTFRIRDWRR
jgi:hypothetical protein